MAPRSSKDDSSILSFSVTLVAAVVSTAAVTFTLTKRREQEKQRIVEYQRYIQQKELQKQAASAAAQESSDGSSSSNNKKKIPSGVLLENIKIEQVYLWQCEDLRLRFPSANVPNDMKGYDDDNKHNTKYNKLIKDQECILASVIRKPEMPRHTVGYMRAGPRSELHFNPRHVNAAIVTCGGLCPGLNNVIREITKSLLQIYAISGQVYGIQGGFRGFYDKSPSYQPILLTVDMVENIHHDGGTILGSSRGGFDLDKILNFLQTKKICQLYVIGGDGTHRGAFGIHEGCMARGLNVSIAGIPKTIDNDVDYIDHSFGFSSAVEAAQLAIRSAKTEATCNLPNGIGIVKLMGRSAGFIAAHATMSSYDVDLCLVPEVPIVLDGPKGCLPHLRRRVQEQGYAVVVVAEGAGEEVLGVSAETDASGNKKLPQIGEFLKDAVADYFRQFGEEATVKYIDPSYTVRSVAANAADSLYCMQLAQNAVHGAMAGFTGFSVGLCNNRMVWLPIPELVATSPRVMNRHGRTWERVLALTRQPNTVPPITKEEEEMYDSHAPMLR